MQWKSSETFAKTPHEIQTLRFILKHFSINSEVQPHTDLYQSLENGERKHGNFRLLQ